MKCVEQPAAKPCVPDGRGSKSGHHQDSGFSTLGTIPISEGIEPESSVCCKVSSWTLCRPPSCEGSVPEISLSARLAMVRLGHAE